MNTIHDHTPCSPSDAHRQGDCSRLRSCAMLVFLGLNRNMVREWLTAHQNRKDGGEGEDDRSGNQTLLQLPFCHALASCAGSAFVCVGSWAFAEAGAFLEAYPEECQDALWTKRGG